jgi:hypothetical protein
MKFTEKQKQIYNNNTNSTKTFLRLKFQHKNTPKNTPYTSLCFQVRAWSVGFGLVLGVPARLLELEGVEDFGAVEEDNEELDAIEIEEEDVRRAPWRIGLPCNEGTIDEEVVVAVGVVEPLNGLLNGPLRPAAAALLLGVTTTESND